MQYKNIFTTNHTGKMKGMVSISTTSLLNSFCQKMQCTKGVICEHCYTNKGFLKTVVNSGKLKGNYNLLTSQKVDWLKVQGIQELSNVKYVRIEAFGELENEIQFRNYLRLANSFKEQNFTIWTKRKDLLENISFRKPKNLTIILSSIKINEPEILTEKLKKKVDKIFTVFSKEEENNVEINCGTKDCISCKLCYTKNKVVYINEQLK